MKNNFKRWFHLSVFFLSIWVFICLQTTLVHSGALDPRTRKMMQEKKLMEEQAAELLLQQQAAEQAVPPPPEKIPGPETIQETINRVTKSSSEWLQIKNDSLKNLIVEYILDQFEDEGIAFEKEPVSEYRKKIDLMIGADPDIVKQKSIAEIVKTVSKLDINYIQTLYDLKHPPKVKTEADLLQEARSSSIET